MNTFRFEIFPMPDSSEIESDDDVTDETGQVIDILEQIRHPDYNGEWTDMSLNKLINRIENFDGQICMVARDEDDEICAAANMRPEPQGRQLYVEGLAVTPESQRQGISKDFVEHIAQYAKQEGFKRLGSRALSEIALRAHYQWGFTEANDEKGSYSSYLPLMYRYL